MIMRELAQVAQLGAIAICVCWAIGWPIDSFLESSAHPLATVVTITATGIATLAGMSWLRFHLVKTSADREAYCRKALLQGTATLFLASPATIYYSEAWHELVLGIIGLGYSIFFLLRFTRTLRSPRETSSPGGFLLELDFTPLALLANICSCQANYPIPSELCPRSAR